MTFVMNYIMAFPKGLILINIILILGMFGDILSLILNNTILDSSTFENAFIILSLVVAGLIIFGLSKRKLFFYGLALVWFGIQIMLALRMIITGSGMETLYHYAVPVTRLLIFSAFIWYLVILKGYFKGDPDESYKRKENIFIGIIIALFIMQFLFTFMLPQFVEIYRINSIMTDIEGKEVPVALDICMNRSDKDYCIVKVVEMNRDSYDFGEGEICEEISSSQRRNSCYLILSECSKITDELKISLCNSLSK